MSDAKHVPMEDTELFRLFVEVADWVWDVVTDWPEFARDTVGKQPVRAADSVGANLVEGDGRYTAADGLRFLIIARASARETRYWIERATKRKLLTSDDGRARVDQLKAATRQLNGLISYRRTHPPADRVREQAADYDASVQAHSPQHSTLNTQDLEPD
jgi:four helix bundle protein